MDNNQLGIRPLGDIKYKRESWDLPGRASDAVDTGAEYLYNNYIPKTARDFISAITGRVGQYAKAVDKFADNPFNVLTPEEEARHSAIRHQPLITGIAPIPGRYVGGVKYGKYATQYAAREGKQFAAKEGQQFIKSQAQNIVRNPGKPGTGTPHAPFSFTTQATAQPSAAHAFTELSKAEAGSFMGGLKPGSVEPVIPWTTKVHVAGIDAKNAIKGIPSKIASGTKSAVSSGVKAITPRGSTAKKIGYGVAGIGVAGTLADFIGSHSEKPKRSEYVTRVANPGKTNGPTKVSDTKVVTPGGTKSGDITPPKQNPPVTPKVDQKAKASSPIVPKSLQPAASTKSDTGTANHTTAMNSTRSEQPVSRIQPLSGIIRTPREDVRLVRSYPTDFDTQALHQIQPIPAKLAAPREEIQLATSHPRVLSQQVTENTPRAFDNQPLSRLRPIPARAIASKKDIQLAK